MKIGVYFTNDSWKYDTRTVNFNNFTISYEQKGGFKTSQEAENTKEKDEEKSKLYKLYKMKGV